MIRITLTLGFCLVVSGCQTPYLIRQVAGGVNLLARARSVTGALADPTVPQNHRDALQQINRALGFAQEQGLDVGNAYQSYVDLLGRPPVWVLYACPPDRLSPKVWSFPLIGEFPYKGFFDLDAAQRCNAQLEQQGLETLLAPASAYSLLGWIPDPIFSSFLEEAPGERVEVLFHELTHRTYFAKGQVAFNESLANFTGQALAQQFLELEYGPESTELTSYRSRLHDRQLFDNLMREVRQRVEKAFEDPDRALRLQGRSDVESWMKSRAPLLGFQDARYVELLEAGLRLPMLLSVNLYHGRPELFEALYARVGEWNKFFERLRALDSSDEPEQQLERWLAS